MTDVDLTKLHIDDLFSLRERVNQLLGTRIPSARREIEVRLKQLERFVPVAAKRGPQKGSKVAPKYRNPLNLLETWSGRGKQPRWITAALKAGKRVSDFRIEEP